MARFSVVVCGGGIAGAEALLRLQHLAGEQLDLTLISPDDHLVYRPQTVVEPFDRAAVRRYPLRRIVADASASLVQDSLQWLDRHQRVVHTVGGASVEYDALLLAVGAREQSFSPHADTFSSRDSGALYRGIVADIEAKRLTRLAFVLPPGPVWPLPLYELALMTARFAHYGGHTVQITLAISEPRPLGALGREASDAITKLLADSGIALYTNAQPQITGPGYLTLLPGQPELEVDRIVSLPILSGPNIPGVPGFALDRFLHIDEYCRVLNSGGRIFAAGDATDLPVKHGGLGAQQADTAAAGIVHLAGLGPAPAALRLHIDATLLTGATPLYVSAYLIAGRGWQTTIHNQPPWPAGDKVIAEELGPYLRELDREVPDQPKPGQDLPAPRPLL